jgi:glycolate oxidase
MAERMNDVATDSIVCLMSGVSAASLVDALARVVPPERLLTRPGALAAYESDGLTVFRARPRAVVIAESQGEVVETVRLCARAGVPFMARGSGTSLSGGAVPIEDGILIALNRLNRILRLDPVSRVAVVEPGVVNLAVTAAAAPHGLYYAPDPSSQQICTIGGNVAFNSGGAHCFRHGMTANHVLGLKAVLADGTLVTVGGDSLEQVGPDATGLFVGSEGLFGVALEITLRLVARPEVYRTVLAAYSSLQAAGDAVSRVIRSGLLPGAMEIMDALAIEAAEMAVAPGYPAGAAALLIVELEGEGIQVAAEFERLVRLLDESGATEMRIARDEEDRARIWKGRKSAFSAVGRLASDFIVQDGVVPRARLGEALASIEALSRKHGIRVANVFHAGDGNLHPLILYDGREAGAHQRAEALAADIMHLCIGLGGSITGEHGVGLEKRRFLPEMYAEADIDCMKRLRRAMDPGELANRGKKLDAGGQDPFSHGLHPLERAGIISRA